MKHDLIRGPRQGGKHEAWTEAMSNIFALPGCEKPANAPNTALVEALRKLLERAESGELQSLIGTGFTSDGLRLAIWGGHHPNVHEMLGALAWLQHEYVYRITEGDSPP